jgi:hypothetical protein
MLLLLLACAPAPEPLAGPVAGGASASAKDTSSCVTASDGLHDFWFCSDRVTWTDAQAACASLGAHLADIEDLTENDWIWAQAEAVDAGTAWWFGLNDSATEGSYEWDGGASSTFTNWRTGEPNDFGGAEDCGRFPDDGAGLWADGGCSNTHAYVCEAGCLYESGYDDADGDGYGDDATLTRGCTRPSGQIATGGDCDDTDPTVSPAGAEVCGGADEDCDGAADDADPSVEPGSLSAWWADTDADGYGVGDPVYTCAAPLGHAGADGDCDDADPTFHPGATDISADGLDQDCDGADRCVGFWDEDGDGYGDPDNFVEGCPLAAGTVGNDLDCDDGDAAIHPDATEVYYDGVDSDCAGGSDYDADADGHDVAGTGDDCDDANPAAWPGAEEVCDGADNDCDGLADPDGVCPCAWFEGEERSYLLCGLEVGVDWYTARDVCDAYGWVLADVLDPAENEALTAISGDTPAWIGLSDADAEGTFAWESGAVLDWTSWRAGEPNAFTEAEDCVRYSSDSPGEWSDSDCASPFPFLCELGCVAETTYADLDGDGWGDDTSAEQTCSGASDRVVVGGDCDDGDADVSPSGVEVCDTVGGDEDCDGLRDDADPSVEPATQTTWYTDADGDGFGNGSAPVLACVAPAGAVGAAGDCDDGSASIYPGAPEAFDGLDNDCNGKNEDEDSDGDGLSDALELAAGCDPFSVDTDGDGLQDWKELRVGSKLVLDSDEDEIPDCADPDPACGCAVGGSPAFAAGLLAMGLVARRRRVSRAPAGGW